MLIGTVAKESPTVISLLFLFAAATPSHQRYASHKNTSRAMSLRLTSIFLFVLAAATQGVSAQSAQGPKFSSRDEYRTCLDEGDKLTPKLPILQARLKEHNQALKRQQDEMEAHAATQPAVDSADQEAVDEFNVKMRTMNQRGKVLNDQAAEYNKELIAYNTQVAAMNKRCAGLIITIKDRDAVYKERLAQGKK